MNLMEAPGFPKQPFCPVCGRTDMPMEGHHVVHRSQGGHDGPLVYICKACHARHHDTQELNFFYDNGEWAWKTDDESAYFNEYNEFDQSIPFYDLDLAELSSLLELQHKLDYLIGEQVCLLVDEYSDEALAEVLVEQHDFSKRGVKNYIKKRYRHGNMQSEAAAYLNVNAANLICDLVEAGHDEEQAVADYLTMPRAQFNETYSIRPKERKPRACKECGAVL